MSRIDHLRDLVAGIGAKQMEYHRFFPAFADRLAAALGDYLGDRECVALCCAEGDFSFDRTYRYEGLGFEQGQYRVPVMFRLRNLHDEGDFLVRLLFYFTKEGTELSARIDDGMSVRLTEANLTGFMEHTYQHLCNALSEASWFEGNRANYRTTAIGFGASP